MSKFKISYPSGATPIDIDELKDLIPDYISTTGELNQLEQSNIADGFVWAGRQDLNDLLSVSFLGCTKKCLFKFGDGLVKLVNRIRILES